MLLDDRILLQAGPISFGAYLLYVLLVLVAVAIVVLVSIWIYRDARRRGENAGLWLALWLGAYFLLTPLGGLIVIVLYLVTRKPAPFPPPPPGPESAWRIAPPAVAPRGWNPVPAPPSPSSVPTTAYVPPRPPGRTRRVKCPRCLTVFDFIPAVAGPTPVKCPACGEEGSI